LFIRFLIHCVVANCQKYNPINTLRFVVLQECSIVNNSMHMLLTLEHTYMLCD